MSITEDQIEFSISCLRVIQPLGEFFIASIPFTRLCEITDFDVRRVVDEERGFETYLGIQRPLNPSRVKEIAHYVNTIDACFPTSVIIAIPGQCAIYDDGSRTLTLRNVMEGENGEIVRYREIAKVLDGQHRIEALKSCTQSDFDINVSIFIDADVADQAYIFSTVNLAQTKVNKSLVMDLYDLAKSRSPQKVSHHIAVALDQTAGSPFYKKIKRLGVSTVGRDFETIAQATFTNELLGYICKDSIEQMRDRDLYKRDKSPARVSQEESKRLIFRNMFIDQRDNDITDVLWNYFSAVSRRWPRAWSSSGQGTMLNKTNGFKALMRFLRPAYLYCTSPGGIPAEDDFFTIFQSVQLDDDDFNTVRYRPGTSGQVQLFTDLINYSTVGTS